MPLGFVLGGLGMEKLSANSLKHINITLEQMLEILNNSYDGIMVTDHKGTITFVSKVAYNNMGISEENLIGKNVRELVKQGIYDHSVVEEAIDSGMQVTGIVTVSNNNRVVSTCTPIFDKNGTLVMTVTNVRVEDLMDKYLQDLKKEKENAKRYKSAINYMAGLDRESSVIIAESPQMKHILSYLEKVAATSSTVFLQGESGTGKEVLSRFVHNESDRSQEPFIPVNCAAIPAELMESEFFGYEKGAFSGALPKGKPGFFEIANLGTLFLDEIGEMPLGMQTKLLRVLESGEVQRIGGVSLIKTDVRIISATNRNLEQNVKDGTFRKDLYYRLNVIPVTIPPLRERKEDILPIARLFMEKFNKKYGTELELTPEMEKTLLEYPWPGNIRELRNLIERMVIVPHETISQLSQEVQVAWNQPAKKIQETVESMKSHSGDLKSLVKATEKAYILRLLEEKEWRINEVAEILGIHRSMLYRKMQEFEIRKVVGVAKEEG